MYHNIYYDREKNRIHLWDDKLGYKSFPYKKYGYILDEDGEYSTIFGEKVTKIFKWTDDMKQYLFESDLSPEHRTLIDLYYDFPDNDYPENNIAFLDIEVETDLGLPNVETADNKITGITIYDTNSKHYHSFILDEALTFDIDNNRKDLTVNTHLTEKELLEEFLNIFIQMKPSIITGWNVEFFDMPYLIRRMQRILGSDLTKRLSPISIIRYSEFKRRFVIAGISTLDYLALYKKFTFSQEASYRLDSIAEKELGKGKIKFEGTIQQLYETDKAKFLEYNINDVELVIEIDNKKKLLDLAIGISHKGRIQYEDIFYPSKYLEGAILCDLKRRNMVAPNKPEKKTNVSFIGAYVKSPVPGKYKWVYDLDLTSLYPSIIMSLNISPETKVAKILDWDEDQFAIRKNRTWKLLHFIQEKHIELDTDGLVNLLNDTGYHISSNGIIYVSQELQEGVMPGILSKWFDERVEYKNLMKKHGKLKDKEKYDFYDKLQNIQKVLLNSLYGVLGLPIFRFYDLDNAAAVTTTGQSVIKFSEKTGNDFYNNILNTNKDYCIYIDTDSLFFSATPLMDHFHPSLDYSDQKTFVNSILEVVSSVQTHINSSYNKYAKEHLFIQGKHRFEIKQELICFSGIWTAKKRYALKVIYREGIFVDKLDVKGLDTVRSSFPPAFKGFMEKTLINILDDVNKDIIDDEVLKLEDSLNSISIMNICKNTSINDIKKYSEDVSDSYYTERILSVIPKGTPAHVKAAIAFNDLIRYYDLSKKISAIKNGEKIKWCYLKKNEFGLDKIAFRGYDDPVEIISFIEKYIDKNAIYEAELKTKLENIYEAVGWKYPSKVQKLANQFFIFERK